MKLPLKKTNLLIPNENIDLTKWTVIACDQYTSNQEYWDNVEKIVGDNPSTLRLTLPEIYLEKEDEQERINKINNTMKEYLSTNVLKEYKDTMFYIERILANKKVRKGLIGVIDLEEYDFKEGSTSLIRATEKTIIERIPPRVKIRENASLELPHIMLLIDNEEKDIIDDIDSSKLDKIYDFDLMNDSGHIVGYQLPENEINRIFNCLEECLDKELFNKKYQTENKDVLLFAVGDGNHSLATAKTIYEQLKETLSEDEYLNHPSRYALVEIVNLHSESLDFEPIHRVVFNVDVENILKELNSYYDLNTTGEGQKFKVITSNEEKTYYISNPKSNLSVGSIQVFLDEYLKDKSSKVDYIHEEEAVTKLIENDNIGFIFDTISKNDLFKTVILEGTLPRKTFSMGISNDKRFYLESRKIK